MVFSVLALAGAMQRSAVLACQNSFCGENCMPCLGTPCYSIDTGKAGAAARSRLELKLLLRQACQLGSHGAGCFVIGMCNVHIDSFSQPELLWGEDCMPSLGTACYSIDTAKAVAATRSRPELKLLPRQACQLGLHGIGCFGTGRCNALIVSFSQPELLGG